MESLGNGVEAAAKSLGSNIDALKETVQEESAKQLQELKLFQDEQKRQAEAHHQEILGALSGINTKVMDFSEKLEKLDLLLKSKEQTQREDEEGEARERQLQQYFSDIDTDGDELISNDELFVAMLSRGMEVEAVSDMFARIDSDKDGHISFDEFKQAFSHNTANVRSQLPKARSMDGEHRLQQHKEHQQRQQQLFNDMNTDHWRIKGKEAEDSKQEVEVGGRRYNHIECYMKSLELDAENETAKLRLGQAWYNLSVSMIQGNVAQFKANGREYQNPIECSLEAHSCLPDYPEAKRLVAQAWCMQGAKLQAITDAITVNKEQYMQLECMLKACEFEPEMFKAPLAGAWLNAAAKGGITLYHDIAGVKAKQYLQKECLDECLRLDPDHAQAKAARERM